MMNYYISHSPLTDESIGIVRKDENDIAFIPLDEMNTDYRAYLAWVGQGNTAPRWTPAEHNLPVITPDGN